MLKSVIDSFATGTYAVTRTTAPVRGADGRPVVGTSAVINVDACVQPLSGRELEVLPESLKTRELRTVFTKVALTTVSGANAADRIAYDGETWEVVKVERYDGFGLGTSATHWESTIAKVTTP